VLRSYKLFTVCYNSDTAQAIVRARRVSGKSTQDGHLWWVRCQVCQNEADTNTGLLPLLKSIHKPCNLKKFSGKTIGVDAYGWLHRGTAACAIDLALDKPTTKYVITSMHNPVG
jgi:hypothetical protein